MSSTPSPRELVELTLRRLNRAATDLGLTPGDRPLFRLDDFSFDMDDDNGESSTIEVYDIDLTIDELDDYSKLATALEKLAEQLAAHKHNQAVFRPHREIDGQMQMFDPDATKA